MRRINACVLSSAAVKVKWHLPKTSLRLFAFVAFAAVIISAVLLLFIHFVSYASLAQAACGMLARNDAEGESTDVGRLPQLPAIGATRITRVAVVGERHSGTNFMTHTLEANLDAIVTGGWCQHKHEYQSLVRTRSRCHEHLDKTLVVVMLRNPYDWAVAMHEDCYCEPGRALALRPFEEFLVNPFIEFNYGKKPWTNETRPSPCGNLMQCRALKYLNFLNISTWAPNVVYVHHEQLMDREGIVAWLSYIIARYRLRSKGNIQHITQYQGFKLAPAAMGSFSLQTAMDSSLWFGRDQLSQNATLLKRAELITQLMDSEVEAMAGYEAMLGQGPRPPNRHSTFQVAVGSMPGYVSPVSRAPETWKASLMRAGRKLLKF